MTAETTERPTMRSRAGHGWSLKAISLWLHRWLGLASGLVVLVVSLSGCLVVFERELNDLVYAGRRFVPAANATSADPMPPSVLFAAARAALPSAEYQSFYYTLEPQQPERAALLWAYDPKIENYWAAHLDQYTGRVLGTFLWHDDPLSDFFGWMQHLHTTLLMGEVGRQVVSAATLVFLVILVSGLVLWWPRSRGAIRPALTLRFSAGAKRINYDVHNVLGFYAGWVLVIVAMTGLAWGYPVVRELTYRVVSGGTPRGSEQDFADRITPASPSASAAPLDRAFAAVWTANRDARTITVMQPIDSLAPLQLAVGDPGRADFPHTEYLFDPTSGRLVHKERWDDHNAGEKLEGMYWGLHTGSLYGLPTKIVAIAASSLAASLPVTGFLIWYPRWRRQRRRPNRRARSRKLPVDDDAELSVAASV